VILFAAANAGQFPDEIVKHDRQFAVLRSALDGGLLPLAMEPIVDVKPPEQAGPLEGSIAEGLDAIFRPSLAEI